MCHLPEPHVDGQYLLGVVSGQYIGGIRVIRKLIAHHITQLGDLLMSDSSIKILKQ